MKGLVSKLDDFGKAFDRWSRLKVGNLQNKIIVKERELNSWLQTVIIDKDLVGVSYCKTNLAKLYEQDEIY